MKLTFNEKKFWTRFSKFYWEKKPLLVKDFASPIREIDEYQIFSMLVMYSNRCRKLKNADGIKFYHSGIRLHEDEVYSLLPEAKDQSLQGYHRRMEEIFSDYCLVCDELLQVSQYNRAQLLNFSNTLFSFVGFPNRFAEIGLYLGNYRQTPFGVHVDGCGVFSFPVVGKKVFRLWPPQFAKKHPDLDRSHDYGRFKKDSKTMKAVPGDMTYWPSSAWHIAESNGSFSATWSLGVWIDVTHQQNLEAALRPLLRTKLGSEGQKYSLNRPPIKANGQVVRLPQSYQHAISVIKDLTTNQIKETLMRDWIRISSAQGLKNSPPYEPVKNLDLGNRVQLVGGEKIQWTDLKSINKRIYAFRGKVWEVSTSSKLLSLVKDLNLKKICLISDYLNSRNGRQDLITLREFFAGGAIKQVIEK